MFSDHCRALTSLVEAAEALDPAALEGLGLDEEAAAAAEVVALAAEARQALITLGIYEP